MPSVVSELQSGSVCNLVLTAAADSQAGGICSWMGRSATAPSSEESLRGGIDLCGNENNNDNMMDIAVLPDGMDIELEEESWSCVRCTFLNHPALNICECCSFERALESGE